MSSGLTLKKKQWSFELFSGKIFGDSACQRGSGVEQRFRNRKLEMQFHRVPHYIRHAGGHDGAFRRCAATREK